MNSIATELRNTGIAWVGKVPTHWKPMRLKDTVEGCANGIWGDDPIGEGSDTPVIRVADFDRNGRLANEYKTLRFVPQNQKEDRTLEPHDLLIEKSGGGEQQPVGMVVEYQGQAGSVCSNFVARMRPRDFGNSRYLTYLHAHLYERSITTLSIKQSTGIQNLDSAAYLAERCFLPPLNEQIAIASYLDAETKRIDELIDAKKELRKRLSGLSQSIFLDELVAISNKLTGIFTRRLPWMPTVPSTWTRCKVKHLVDHFDQGVSPQCESRQPDEGEWGVLKAGCINSGEFDPTESKALPPEILPMPDVTVCAGDLIISRANTRDLVGRSAVARHDYPMLMLSDKLYRLKLDKVRCIPEFVRRTLWIGAVRSRIEERATGASPSMQNIDKRTILELDIVLPSIAEQQKVLAEVDRRTDAIQRLIEHVDVELNLLIEMRSSTITDAVLGRIDVSKTQTH
jgi:type I restriction enzyme S subunit